MLEEKRRSEKGVSSSDRSLQRLCSHSPPSPPSKLESETKKRGVSENRSEIRSEEDSARARPVVIVVVLVSNIVAIDHHRTNPTLAAHR